MVPCITLAAKAAAAAKTASGGGPDILSRDSRQLSGRNIDETFAGNRTFDVDNTTNLDNGWVLISWYIFVYFYFVVALPIIYYYS